MTQNQFEKKDFNNPEFLVQMIARGSFIDRGCPPKVYQIDVYSLRLNWYALNGFLESWCCNTRACYEKEEDWLAHKAEMDGKREAWERKILDSIGLGDAQTGFHIVQVTSEIFSVTFMQETSNGEK